MTNNTEDKAFFSVTAFIGTITEYNTILQTNFLSPEFINAIGSAATLAFVSGFVGLIGKKMAEALHDKGSNRKNKGEEP